MAILAQERSRSKWTLWQYQTTCFTGVLLISCSVCLHPFAFRRFSDSWPHVSPARCWCIWQTCTQIARTALALTSMVWAPALESQRMKSSMLSSQNLCTSKRRSRKYQLSRIGCPEWIRTSQMHLEDLRLNLQRWNKISAPSLHTCSNVSRSARSWPSLEQVDGSTAVARGRPTTTGTRGVYLIPLPAQRMNTHEVPLCFFPCEQYHAGVSTWLEKFWATTNEPVSNKLTRICPKGLSLKQELSVKNLWHDTWRMVSHMRWIVHFVTPVPISRSASPSQSRIEKLEDALHLCGKHWPQNSRRLWLNEMLKMFFIVPAFDVRAQILSILDGRNRVGKSVFKFALLGHEHPFDLTAPDLCVPGIPDDVLRQVICQASHPAQNRTANV